MKKSIGKKKRVDSLFDAMGLFGHKREKQVEEYLSKVYKNLLWLAFIYPRLDGRFKYLSIFQFGLYVTIFVLNTNVFLRTAIVSSDMIFSAEYLLYASFGVITFNTIVTTPFRRNAATEMYKIYLNDFQKYDENMDMTLKKDIQEQRNALKMHLKVILFFILFVPFNILFVGPFIERYFESKEDAFENADVSLPVTVWSPDTNSSFVHYALIFMQISMPFISSVIITGGCVLYMHMCQTMIDQTKILSWLIINVEKRGRDHFLEMKNNDEKWNIDDSINFCLTENIKHLITLQRFNKKLEYVVSPPLFSVSFFATFFIAFAGYVGLKSEGHPGKLFSGFFFVGLEAYIMAFFNIYGQIIIDESEKLRVAIYGVNWYNFDVRAKRSLSIMQDMTFYPMKIKLGGMMILNMETYQKVMNSAYSFINLLLAFN